MNGRGLVHCFSAGSVFWLLAGKGRKGKCGALSPDGTSLLSEAILEDKHSLFLSSFFFFFLYFPVDKHRFRRLERLSRDVFYLILSS